MTVTATASVSATAWDEPAGAASPRGWFYRAGTVTGFYLDYGPEHYRSPHRYCGGINRLCRECEPGNVLAVRYPGGPGTGTESRYCETVAEARAYVETGRVPEYVVTFDPRPVAGPGAIDGLRRMSLPEARALLELAARIPKRGRIVDAETLATV